VKGSCLNIFKALNRGNGRISETNMSAMLAYLLDPRQPHGLGHTFLEHFLRHVQGNMEKNDFFEKFLAKMENFEVVVELEGAYSLPGPPKITRSIDVSIQIISTKTEEEIHRIAIENKIKPQAADPLQLKEEFQVILDSLGDAPTPVTMVFLTPQVNHAKLNEEFDMLDESTLNKNHKVRIFWDEQKDKQEGVSSIIRNVLMQEMKCEIEPISDYVRHTLKAFVQFIEYLYSSSPASDREFDPGDPLETITVDLNQPEHKGKFEIIRYSSTAIKAYQYKSDEDGIEKTAVEAKSVLRAINDEFNLNVPFIRATNKKLRNTREIGRDVMKAYNQLKS